MRFSLSIAAFILAAFSLATAPAFAQAPVPRRVPPLAGKALERFQNMTPEQREKALSRLPPERRAQIEQRLNRLQQLPPEQRDQLVQRYQEFQSLPRERQLSVRGELQALRRMNPRMRQRRINSPEFQRDFSPEEQKILREAIGR